MSGGRRGRAGAHLDDARQAMSRALLALQRERPHDAATAILQAQAALRLLKGASVILATTEAST